MLSFMSGYARGHHPIMTTRRGFNYIILEVAFKTALMQEVLHVLTFGSSLKHKTMECSIFMRNY